MTRRWCVGCLEDYAEDDSALGHCLACEYEHERAVLLSGMTFGKHNASKSDWWGPTIDDINEEDIAFGFYETTIGLELEDD